MNCLVMSYINENSIINKQKIPSDFTTLIKVLSISLLQGDSCDISIVLFTVILSMCSLGQSHRKCYILVSVETFTSPI